MWFYVALGLWRDVLKAPAKRNVFSVLVVLAVLLVLGALVLSVVLINECEDDLGTYAFS